MEVSKFNPCSSQHHAMEAFKKLTVSNKIITLALSSLAAFLSFGLLAAFVFRTLTDKFTVTKNLKPDSPQEETAKKVDIIYSKEQVAQAPTIPKQSQYKLQQSFREEIMELYFTNEPTKELTRLASEITDSSFFQRIFNDLYDDRILIVDVNSHIDRPNLELLKFFVETCGVEIDSSRTIQLYCLPFNDIKEFYDYLIKIKPDYCWENIPQEELNEHVKESFVTSLAGRSQGVFIKLNYKKLDHLIEKILSQKISLKGKETELENAFCLALRLSDKFFLKILVKAGFDFNQKILAEFNKKYPLEHVISWQEGFEIIEPKSPKFEYADLSGYSQEEIKSLTKEGFGFKGREYNRRLLKVLKDINGKHFEDETLLNLAIRNRLDDVITLLIEEGVDRQLKTKDGKTPLDYYIEKNEKINPSTLRALVRSSNVIKNDSVSEEKKKNLQAFIKGEQTETTKDEFETFIKEIEDINALTFDVEKESGKTAMHLVIFAVECENFDVLDMLYKAGADVHCSSDKVLEESLKTVIDAFPEEKKAAIRDWFNQH